MQGPMCCKSFGVLKGLGMYCNLVVSYRATLPYAKQHLMNPRGFSISHTFIY